MYHLIHIFVTAGNGIDFISDTINATFAPREQQTIIRIPILEDELVEDVEYFGIRFILDSSDAVSAVVFTLGNITLAVGGILDASGMCVYTKLIS